MSGMKTLKKEKEQKELSFEEAKKVVIEKIVKPLENLDKIKDSEERNKYKKSIPKKRG